MSVELTEEVDDDDVKPDDFKGILSYTTDWTVETIISQLKQSTFNLQPLFQRRDAWGITRKSKFIESIILGMPVPQITLAQVNTDTPEYIVLDGKQRLLSLLQFTGNADGPNNLFKLNSLSILDIYNKHNVEDLKVKSPSDYKRFLNFSIRTIVISNLKNKKILNTIFYRLNTSSVQLSTQELRQALHSGPFTKYLFEYTEHSSQIMDLLQNDRPDYRMRDVELSLRFIAFSTRLKEYSGVLSKFLDDTCDEYNAQWEKRESKIVDLLAELDKSLAFLSDVFGRDIARKWSVDKYENNLNRAILDVVLYYFKDPKLRKYFTTPAKKRSLVTLYKSLFKDTEFEDSVTATTKSIRNVAYRFNEMGKQLTKLTKIKLVIPRLDERQNRIVVG